MKRFLTIGLLLLAGSAGASEQTGKPTAIIVRASDGLIHFYMDGARTAKPACANAYWMIKAENSETGKRQFSMLMQAREAGRTIKVTGTGTCTRWVDGEDVDQILY